MPIATRNIARSGLSASVINGLQNPNPWTRTLYVDSGHSRAEDKQHTGLDEQHPLKTLQKAVSNARAGDLIIVGPGHTETVDVADYIDFNLADLHVLGLGNGDRRPKFTFKTLTTANMKISAAGVTLENLNFVAGLAAIVQLFDVAAADAAFLGCVIQEDSGHVIDAIVLATDSHRCLIDGLQARQPTSGGQSCIQFPAANDVVITNCDITGHYGIACIENGTAATQVIITGNLLESINDADKCISMHASTSGRCADNRCRNATDGQLSWIVAADMDWFENYGVNLDGETGKLIGTVSS